MAKVAATLTTSCSQSLEALGKRLRDARLRRLLSAEAVAAQAGITRQTLNKIESGVPSVTIGSYIRVLELFGLMKDFVQVANDAELRRQLRDGDFLLRERAPRRERIKADEAAMPRPGNSSSDSEK